MSTGERLPLDPSIAVGNHLLYMEVLLTAIATGLLVATEARNRRRRGVKFGTPLVVRACLALATFGVAT
jgi:hypothetical protein